MFRKIIYGDKNLEMIKKICKIIRKYNRKFDSRIVYKDTVGIDYYLIFEIII